MNTCMKCQTGQMSSVERVVDFPKDPRIQMRFRMMDCVSCGYTTAADDQREHNTKQFHTAWTVAFPKP